MDAAETLPADVDPEVLGSTIRKVFSASVLIPRPPPGPDDFDDQLGRRFGLKNGRSLYAGVRVLSLEEREGWFTCTPMRHRRGFDYDAFPPVWKEQQPTRIPSDASDAEWGATALQALRLSV